MTKTQYYEERQHATVRGRVVLQLSSAAPSLAKKSSVRKMEARILFIVHFTVTSNNNNTKQLGSCSQNEARSYHCFN